MTRTDRVVTYTLDRKRSRARFIYAFSLLSAVVFHSHYNDARAEESHPGLGLESAYSEAVIAFNRRQTAEAIRILDGILKNQPDHVQSLELKALALKDGGDDRGSADVYRQLLKLKPDAERGPYHFELGVILNRQKQPELARAEFERALERRFNEVTDHLFLGIIHFNAGRYAESERSFRRVKADGTPELKVVARYYLGLIHFKNGYGAGGASEMAGARRASLEVPDSRIAADIRTAADKVLEPFRSPLWFGNVSAIGSYDSNVGQLPTGLVEALASSGQSTPKLTLSGGLGYMSPSASTLQWVASYRFNGNHNFNSDTHNYEYFINTASVYLNYLPLAETTGGLKAEGSFGFQNQQLTAGEASGGYQFQKYTLAGDVGPYVRFQLNPRLQAQIEAGVRPQTYYSQPELSGTALSARAALRMETDSPLLAPAFTLGYEKMSAASDDYSYGAYGAGVSDRVRLGTADSLTATLDVLFSSYASVALGRSDRNVAARVSYLHTFSNRWSLLGDLSYVRNASTVDTTYSYDRLQLGVGVSWNL